MYRIAVCEDEPTLQEGLCTQCREILTRLELEEALQTCLRRNDQPKAVTLQGGGKIAVLPLADI